MDNKDKWYMIPRKAFESAKWYNQLGISFLISMAIFAAGDYYPFNSSTTLLEIIIYSIIYLIIFYYIVRFVIRLVYGYIKERKN